jgi:hypothetical protein
MGVATALSMEPEVVGIPSEILDGPAWLLIMRISG